MHKPAPSPPRNVLDAMIRKLGVHAELTDGDRQALAALPHVIRSVDAGAYLEREGEAAREYIVLLAGYAYRHKMTRDGGRQIVSVQLPGEALACASLFFDSVDHTTQALTGVQAAYFSRAAFADLVRRSAAISHSLLLITLIEVSIANEWQLNLGRRDAKARIAHLLCEFAARSDAAGLANDGAYDMPLTQVQMGDALGLTSVHVNRMLKELRDEGLIMLDRKSISIPKRAELARIGDFSDAYLRLDQPRGSTGIGASATPR